MAYDHISLEQKWQKYWTENKTFETKNPPFTESKPKKYILDMFPYPSGAGLHVGHPKGYTATDIMSRYYHAKGYNVLHPMGFDAFGLPAENYAVKTGTHPKVTTEANIAVFTEQLKALGFSYDWDRIVDTTDPEYYRWTQWIFLELFKRGLAYEAEMPVNWCPALKAVLANEEVVDGKSEIGGHPVEKKLLRQWVLRITEYADRLITDLDGLDWPEGIKEMQRNWIGKSEGCEFELRKSDDASKSIRVYTTRVDTVYGMTYAVLAPDHPSVTDFITDEYRTLCEEYIREAKGKSDQDRTNEGKEKTGVFTGSYVINPYNGESVPLWIADYVLGSYGTGAVMAVPAHDERDFEFAKKYNLSVRQSIGQSIVLSGKNAPRKEAETQKRDTVNAIIEFDEKFLILEEKENIRLLGGGIEFSEGAIETIQREIIEETGYFEFQNIQAISNTELFTLGYHHKKLHNSHTHDMPIYHVVLKSLRQKEVDAGELAWHTPRWVEKDEVAKLLTFEMHSYQWAQFLCSHATKDDGILINSGEYTGLSSSEARQVFSEKAEKEGFGHKKVNYKLRDWLFSRQRYWGEPIPLIHISNQDFDMLPRVSETSEAIDPSLAYILDKKGTEKRCKNCTCGDVGCVKLIIGGKTYSRVYDGLTGKLVIDSSLPLLLPEVEKYEPSGDGQSPLANVTEWVHVELAENLRGKRETNTMPQWGGSCWYYLRYMDSKNPDVLAGRDAMDYWQSVDEYVGGAEHAVLHLLYARFWHKVLYDIGVVPTIEPFQKLTNVGLILGPDGQKMSKSRGNVINPNDIVGEYGADTLRLYEMSMGAFTDPAPWNTEAIIGVRRFLDRAYATYTEGKNIAKDEMKAMKLLHKTVKKVGEDLLDYKFNTALSALMILLNEGLPTDAEFALEWKEKFAIMLHPYAPHMAEELWSMLGKSTSIYSAEWPEYDDFMLIDDEVTIAIQVNGKLRGTLTCMNGVMQDEVAILARENPDIAKWIEGKILVKEIFIPNKMLSIVVKD